jgi:hypothetical protein
VCAASLDAIVYVNGRRLRWQGRLHAGPDGSVALYHNDRLSLGHCAYALLVVDPTVSAAAAASSGGPSDHEVRGVETVGLRAMRGAACRVWVGSCAILRSFHTPHAAPHASWLLQVTFDSCVHEVVLQRAHGAREYQERLARFVVRRRWRGGEWRIWQRPVLHSRSCRQAPLPELK